MGSKVNPNGLRYGINKIWQSRWFAKNNKQMAEWLVQDDLIRKLLIKKYSLSKIDHIEIERDETNINLFIYCVQPGVIFGTENSELKNAILLVNKIVGKNIKVKMNIVNVPAPDLSARIVAREIADAIENRVSFRNAQKSAIRKVLHAGAKGVKTHVSGRLGGVEMAREEGYSEGIITLSTLRANIDYALEEAHTTYGIIGVKVWINRGEIFKKSLPNNKKPNYLPKDSKSKPAKSFANRPFKSDKKQVSSTKNLAVENSTDLSNNNKE